MERLWPCQAIPLQGCPCWVVVVGAGHADLEGRAPAPNAVN